MGKRRRDDGGEGTEERPSANQRGVEHKLEVGLTNLGHAFKVSKGFERQKLGRRRKNAVALNDEKGVARIDSEILALRALESSVSAQQLFYKTLLKIKPVSEHTDLPGFVKKPIVFPLDTATLNVHARMCKANPVKEALAASVADVQHALRLEPERRVASRSGKPRAEDREARNSEPSIRSTAYEVRHEPSAGEKVSPETNEDDPTAFDDRVAGSSDEADEGVSDVEEMKRQLLSESVKRTSAPANPNEYSLEAELSISQSEFDPPSASPEPPNKSASRKASFLPSLTMGGYVSGSGSDTDDDSDVARKKNRRGQRARQQIWGQKYGSSANHLQRPNRDKGWDPKRGAVDGSERGWNPRNRQQRRSKADDILRGDGALAKPKEGDGMREKKHRDDDGPIHPSWEAAKKAKEKKEVPFAFQGKKTTFD